MRTGSMWGRMIWMPKQQEGSWALTEFWESRQRPVSYTHLDVYKRQPEARQVVETEIENMLNNHISPQDTAANMAKQINKAIEEYNLLNE